MRTRQSTRSRPGEGSATRHLAMCRLLDCSRLYGTRLGIQPLLALLAFMVGAPSAESLVYTFQCHWLRHYASTGKCFFRRVRQARLRQRSQLAINSEVRLPHLRKKGANRLASADLLALPNHDRSSFPAPAWPDLSSAQLLARSASTLPHGTPIASHKSSSRE